MNRIARKLLNQNEKELFFKILLVSSLVIGVCSRGHLTNEKIPAIKLTQETFDSFGDFDKVHVPNKPSVIAQMITVLKPEFSMEQSHFVANKIHQAFLKYKIEPQIVVAIIDTESNFNHDLVSSTGDLSLAQVNVEVWNKEFSRMKLNLIEADKLKADQAYSLEVMAQILNILKTRYGKADRRWYARYHSKTKKHKKVYLTKLESRMKLLEKSRIATLH